MKFSTFFLLYFVLAALFVGSSKGDEVSADEASIETGPGDPDPNQDVDSGGGRSARADNTNDVDYSISDLSDEDLNGIDLSSVAESVESSNKLLSDMKAELDDFVQKNYEGKDAMKKMITESSNLAKKMGSMFQRLTKREAEMVDEMKELKEHLQGGLADLKNTFSADGNRFPRHLNAEHGAEGPYRACVTIESVNDGRIMNPVIPIPPRAGIQGGAEARAKANNPSPNVRLPLPPPSVQEFMPGSAPNQAQPANSASNGPPSTGTGGNGPNQQPRSPNSASNGPPSTGTGGNGPNQQPRSPNSASNGPPATGTGGNGPIQQQASGSQQQPNEKQQQQQEDDIYLSQTSWLRLNADRKPENVQQILNNMLKNNQQNNKDLLLIPISHGFKSPDEVKDGFMRAVRIRPEAIKNLKLKSPLFRKLRSLQIREI